MGMWKKYKIGGGISISVLAIALALLITSIFLPTWLKWNSDIVDSNFGFWKFEQEFQNGNSRTESISRNCDIGEDRETALFREDSQCRMFNVGRVLGVTGGLLASFAFLFCVFGFIGKNRPNCLLYASILAGPAFVCTCTTVALFIVLNNDFGRDQSSVVTTVNMHPTYGLAFWLFISGTCCLVFAFLMCLFAWKHGSIAAVREARERHLTDRRLKLTGVGSDESILYTEVDVNLNAYPAQPQQVWVG
eukprot:Nk52_evm36s239 gene=Nk52_evmTU36s239